MIGEMTCRWNFSPLLCTHVQALQGGPSLSSVPFYTIMANYTYCEDTVSLLAMERIVLLINWCNLRDLPLDRVDQSMSMLTKLPLAVRGFLSLLYNCNYVPYDSYKQSDTHLEPSHPSMAI